MNEIEEFTHNIDNDSYHFDDEELQIGENENWNHLFQILTHLTDLHLENDYNQFIDFTILTNLKVLRCGNKFNQPMNLKHDFKHPIDTKYLTNLTHLEFGAWFNQPIDLTKLTNLESFDMNDRYYNHTLDFTNCWKLKYIDYYPITYYFATKRLIHYYFKKAFEFAFE